MKSESVRQRKLADQIKKQVSQIIDRKLKDPRKGLVTLTHVRVSGDLRIAFIYYTVLGDQEKREQSQEALDSATNFIRNELAPSLKMRFIPELRFFYDESLDYSRHIEDILKKIKHDEPDPDDGKE
ncbi:MAG: 30S ribosome-binding factor RbfA [Calditrichia bacterium]